MHTEIEKYLLIVLCLLLVGCGRDDPAVVSTVEHAKDGIFDAVISQDGHFAVVSAVTHGVGYWDLDKNALKYIWHHGKTPYHGILNVAIAPDNAFVITATKLDFMVWNTANGKNIAFFEMPAKIIDVALSNKGRYILIGLINGEVHHIDFATRRRVVFLGHTESVNTVSMSANGAYALTASNDHKALLWNTKTAQIVHEWPHQSRVTLAILSPKGNLALTISAYGQFNIWNIADGKLVSRLDVGERETAISAARFSEDEKILLTGSASRLIRRWDVKTGRQLNSWKATAKKYWVPSGAIIYDIGFAPDKNYFITEASNGLSQKWKID